MTAADASFLERSCPDVLLGLMALQLLLNRIDQREETESILLDTGNTVKTNKSLERAVALEGIARKACHEMLRRIGTLPELDENYAMAILAAPKSARRKPIAPTKRGAEQDPYSAAAKLLGATENP